MSNIRKKAIISTGLLYIGFAIGALNIYLYTKNGAFTEAQFGLTRLFFDFGQNIYSFASLGAITVLAKFYPYYKDNLSQKDNDLFTWVLLAVLTGFLIVVSAGIIFKPLVVRKYSHGSQLFVDFYYWVFPFGLGMLLFTLIECLSSIVGKPVLPSFLKETVFRLLTTMLIVLYYLNLIRFDDFVRLFSGLYIAIFLMLSYYLASIDEIKIIFRISRVTKKFWKKIFGMQATFFVGVVISVLGQTLDGILIGSLVNISAAAVFTLAQYLANLVQVPQRSLQSITIGPIVRAWKDKDREEVARIYSRSCINMLLASMFIFGNVVLCAKDGIIAFNLKTTYLQGIEAMVILGIMRIIDAGTGVNGIVIMTSSHWRFDFYSGIVMLALIVPTNYFLIKQFGIIGSAYAQLISFCVYNYIRFEFIRRKFGMQPFNRKTLISIAMMIGDFFLCGWLGSYFPLIYGIIVKAALFSTIFLVSTIGLGLSPDAEQLWAKWKPRFLQ